MKSFLMYMDRDFDKQQVLIRREKNFRPWDTVKDLNLEQLLPWNENALIQDLGLKILLDSMGGDDNFLFEASKVTLLSCVKDTATILYRQNILRDCIKNELITREIYQLVVDTIAKEKDIYGWGFLNHTPESILHQAVGKLQMFSEMLRKLRNIAEENYTAFNSDGFRRLFDTLKQELSDNYLDIMDEYLRELKFTNGILVTADLGYGSKGTNYILHKPPEGNHSWWSRLLSQKQPGYTFELHPRDEAGARALSSLRNQSINSVANALAQSMDHILSFFNALRTELAFYIGCLNLKKKLDELQEPICFPTPVLYGNRKMSFSGLYDICLSLGSGRKVVANDLIADGKDLFIITGANTGGKSTFMRSLGLAQLMMQAGMFVSANSFSAEIRDCIVTHFKREEDITMESGKLDEELSRMNEILNRINPKSMLLFNESFSATNEIEGSEIAKQITNALVERGIKVIFVTHQYEFAYSLYNHKMENAVFLRAERLADGTRTFRITEGEPLQTSYGEDLYKTIFQ